jgi:hypothetical protein
MNFRQVFKSAVAGIRRRRIEPGPFASAPSVSEHDARVIIADANLRMFSDVEFYGPGADEVEARRAARILPKGKAIAIVKAEDPHDATKKKRRRMTRRERLEAKAEKLRAEIAALKGKK